MYRLEITKRIANGGVVTIAVTALLSAVFWFLPLVSEPAANEAGELVFMGNGLFAVPIVISKVLAFVFWAVVWYSARSVLTFVIGMAVVTAVCQLQFFDSGMVAFGFFYPAWLTVFDFYSVSNQVNESFRAVLLILISSLFVPEYIWMLSLFFLGLVVFKVGSARIFISFAVALLVFVWLVWGVCFSIGEVSLFYDYVAQFANFDFFSFQGNVVHIVGLTTLFVAVTVVMIALIGISHKYDARMRMNGTFINIAFILTFAMTVVCKEFNSGLLATVVLMAALVFARYFSTERSNFANIAFLVFLVLLFAYRVTDGLIKLEI